MKQKPTGIITFLFSDIVGSTMLWDKFPESMREDLQLHDRIIKKIIGKNSGYVFKTVGDAFCAVFATATEALVAGLEIQLTLAATSWQVPGGIAIRIGIHTGEAEYREDDYFGTTVNTVARITGAAHGGQILVSSSVAAIAGQSIPQTCILKFLGKHRLKGLEVGMELFQLDHPGLQSDFPPITTSGIPQSTIAGSPTSIIGRQKELDDIARLIEQEGCRLVTLTGPGGTGKTRIALHLISELAEHFSDGRYFIDLSSCVDLSSAARTVAKTLGIIDYSGDGTSPVKQIIRVMEQKQFFLVLDNYEQLISAASLPTELLAACPDCSILVTSREPLHVRGEREYPIPPLSLPGKETLAAAHTITQYDAVRLFIERALSVNPEFRVSNENAPAVAEICQRLDGLPLAIELAAVRIKFFPPEKLLERLVNRLGILTGGYVDLPSRQRTLRSTIDWSHDLLSSDEKTVFRRLAVFMGGCSLEAGEIVIPEEHEHISIWDIFISLTDKSMLKQKDINGESRFYMLETVHEYALERFRESNETEATTARYKAWIANYTRKASGLFFSPSEERALSLLDVEEGNILEALRLFRASKDHVQGLSLTVDMGWYWYRKVHHDEGISWLTIFIEALPEAGNDLLRANGYEMLGRLHLMKGWSFRAPAIAAYFSQSIDLYRHLGEQRKLADVLSKLAWLHELPLFENLEEGYRLFDESVRIARETNDAFTMATTFLMCGFCLEKSLEEREALMEEARLYANRTGSQILSAHAQFNTSWMYLEAGLPEKALPYALEALQIGKETGDLWILINSCFYISWSSILLGKLEDAAQSAYQNLKQCAKVGCLSYFITSLDQFCMIANRIGKPEAVAICWAACESIRNPTVPRLLEDHWMNTIHKRFAEIPFEVMEKGYNIGFTLPQDELLKYVDREIVHGAGLK